MKLFVSWVQSVAVRLIVERFNENLNFKPQDYFGAEIQLNGEKYNFDRVLAEAAGVDAVTTSSMQQTTHLVRPVLFGG